MSDDYEDDDSAATGDDEEPGSPEHEDDNPFVVKNLDKSAKNIAEQMTTAQRKDLGALASEDVKADLESREDMSAKWDRWAKFYAGQPEQSALSSRSGAPNIHTPGGGVAVDHYSSRAEKYLMPPGRIAKAEGTGSEDHERAWRVAKFVNVQIEKRIPKFRRNIGTAIKQSAIFGTAAIKSWWNAEGGHPMVAAVPAEDFIIAYTHSGPIENAPRITHRLRLSRDEIRAGVKAGIYCSDCWDLGSEDASNSEEEDGLAATRRELDGWEPAKGSSDPGPMEVYEQHRMLDLDGDGIGEPYVVTIHAESETLMRVVSRVVKNPAGEEETLNFFTEMPFDYNPLGFYGLGIGAKTEGLTVLANSAANLVLFAALRNSFPPKVRCKSAFDTEGEKDYELDEWIETKAHIDDVSKTFFIVPTTPPSPVLMQVYQQAQADIREAVSVTNIMTGQEQPHNQAAATSKILQQESMEMFNAAFRRMLDAMSELLTKIYQLNRLYLTDEEYAAVLGDDTGQTSQKQHAQRVAEWKALTGQLLSTIDAGQPPHPGMVQQLIATDPPPEYWVSVADDFADSFDLIPTCDPNLTTEQERLAQSEQSLALITQGPEQPSPHSVWAAKRYRLEALRVPSSVIDELLPEPQEPPPPPNLGPQEAIAAILKGQPVVVMPDQPHPAYIQAIQQYKEREGGQLWAMTAAPTKEALERHAQERIAAILEQEAKNGQQAPVPLPPGAGQAPGPADAGTFNMGIPPGGPMVSSGAGAPNA